MSPSARRACSCDFLRTMRDDVPASLSKATASTASPSPEDISSGSSSPEPSADASFRQRYHLGRVLGTGAFSVVRVAVDRTTGQRWACKMVTEQNERELLKIEVDILRQLDHPSIVKYHEHYDERDHLYILTELLEGPDLLTSVTERGSYSEQDAATAMRQVLSALDYLSSKGVAHRDIKLENIILVPEEGHTRVKIIDFGLADQLSETKTMFRQPCGTPLSVAPEVVRGLPYSVGCDVWSAGVLLFRLLSGDYPFVPGNCASELFRRIEQANLDFKDLSWQMTSKGAQDMVRTLLTPDPRERPTAKEALGHPWLS